MRKQTTVKQLIVFGIINLISFSANAQATVKGKSNIYKAAVHQSKVLWKGPKSVGNKHYGYILLLSGKLNENADGKFTNGDFVLDMNSIHSTDYKEEKKRKEVDDLLKGNDFFGVRHYPTAVMKVNSITATTQAYQFKIQGNLSLKGVTKTIAFLAKIKKVNTTITIQGNLAINRHDWGIDAKKKDDTSLFPDFRDKLIADEIPVSLNLILNKI